VGISRVAYRYDRASGTLSVHSEPQAYRLDSPRSEDVWRPVLRGVAGVALEFHDGRKWQGRWDSKQAGRLPQAVRVGLAIQDEGGRTHRYTTAIPILCQTSTREPQDRKQVAKP
jgi:hypothetical protein